MHIYSLWNMSTLHIAFTIVIFQYVGCTTYELQEPFSLRQYNNYADVHFAEFEIPDAADWTIWKLVLLADKNRPHCAEENISATVYLQYGGFPVFNALNETFPPGFPPSTSYYTKVTLSTANGSRGRYIELFQQAPEAGRWFVASFINPEAGQTKKIRPKGIDSASCKHYIRISVAYNLDKSYHEEPLPIGVPRVYTQENEPGVLRYFIPKHIYKYTIRVIGCKVLYPSGADCSFRMESQGDRLPTESNRYSQLCDWSGGRINGSECQLIVNSPVVNRWHYTAIISRNDSQALQITIQIDTEGCSAGASTATCEVDEYYTDTVPGNPYTADFVRNTPTIFKGQIIIRDDKAYLGSFDVESLVHSGGTLQYKIQPNKSLPSDRAVIYSCISRGVVIVDPEQIKSCAKINNSTLELGSTQAKSEYFIPYPQSGTYYVSVISGCYNSSTTHDDSTRLACVDTLTVSTNVTLRPCVNNKCGKYGTCYLYYNGVIHWSVCKCHSGYRGYGCTDATNGISDNMQLFSMLLLTLSNILFFVAGAWAIYRRWFSEALIYFFVLIASSFYHACDNGTIYTLCVVQYSMLQYCDFYGSILAVWMTAMALAKLPHKLRSFLHVAGVLGILIGTQYSLDGLWNFVIPLIVAAVILASSWVRMCWKQKACFPGLRISLTQLLPGIGCSVTGLFLYSLVETDKNYFYVHSIWHLLMASSIVFLIPRDEKLQWSSIKSWCCKLKIKRRRNEVVDGEVTGDNRRALIHTTPSDSTVADNAEGQVT